MDIKRSLITASALAFATAGQVFAAPPGTNRLGGAVDTDALESYFAANSPVAPGPRNRILVLP